MWFSAVLDALFPATCFGCGLAGQTLCPACRPSGRRVVRLPPAALEVLAAGSYEGPLRTAILAYKRGRRDAGDALAGVLATAMEGSLPERAVFVPVPTAAGRRRERGFDQGVWLAQELGARMRIPVLLALRHCAGDTQRGRSRSARLAARGRFACTAAALVDGARIVLVDDVVTTGATLADCATVLRACGADVREALVLACA